MPNEYAIKESNPKDAIGANKAKLSVIPAGVLFDLGNAMVEGMAKYGRHNYRAIGVRSSVYYDAAMGHLMDWWEGQDIDAESGLSHITKAMASLTVLRDAMLQDKLHDDRPPRSKVYKSDFSPMTAAIIERHKDKNPHHYTLKDSDAQCSGNSQYINKAIRAQSECLSEFSTPYQNGLSRCNLLPTQSGGGSGGIAGGYIQSPQETGACSGSNSQKGTG